MNRPAIDQQPIDGIPALSDFPAQDVAMDVFRMFFPLPATCAHVSEDGFRMTYTLRHGVNTESYLQIARLTIATKELDLEAKVDEFKIGDMVIENILIITYTGE